jgi:cell division protein FtsI (penicillin-binding protein 3)
VSERLGRSSGFRYVARWVAPERAERVRALELPGVGILDEPRRVYPHRELAASVLGFANIDGAGVRGIEQQEDAWLRGRAQSIPVERDNRGRLLFPAGVDPRSASGGDVALTLHAVLQAEAEQALDEAIRSTRARAGTVLSLDPRTGDVLALAERPTYDPNRFREATFSETRSRAFLDVLEPGSTLKVFVVAGALDAGAIGPRQLFDCEAGSFRVPGKTIRDRHPFGWLDAAGVLRVSSNVGATKIAYALGAESHARALRRFGFGAPTGSGFPDEAAGLLRDWREWRPVDHANVAFGQGVNVTAVQLAAATAALADGGLWRRPRLVLARRARGGDWEPAPAPPPRRAVSPATAAAVLEMMTGVVGPEGTGRLAALRDLPVAGKTGTAQKIDRATGTYADDRYIAWFVGVVPANDPRLVIVTMLDEPVGVAHTGGMVAAPLFARVAAAQLRSLGIVTRPDLPEVRMAQADPAPEPVPVERAPEARPPARSAPRAPAAPARPAAATPAASPATAPSAARVAAVNDRVLLPDFRGLSPDEVKQLTAGRLQLEFQGRGVAVAQEPEPGTILAGASRRVRVRFAGDGT